MGNPSVSRRDEVDAKLIKLLQATTATQKLLATEKLLFSSLAGMMSSAVSMSKSMVETRWYSSPPNCFGHATTTRIFRFENFQRRARSTPLSDSKRHRC
jgi:hypothetical protein